ncbi:EAL and HDOD domain-containing protein [Pseudoduganella violacea]|uniref:EAL and modified HD-GYP domain-containing signal transduction protein n=1 Tax=Pseudoduganella violacea TaxID=1715466 RepID=A0A7W5BE68_9BURK|nr:HDOD domain-containing protein [Pseudoduganella violacea]MBB3121270.1 EAL and modified HD-GYP domain-containing signal transduction protein [Pseudoduganella violacea]
MIAPTLAPVFLQLLADRKGQPAALLFAAALPGETAAAEALPAGAPMLPEVLTGLAAASPCFYPDTLEEPLAAALADAGWQPLPAAELCRADSMAALDDVPPGAHWVRGDWALDTPPKGASGQAGTSRGLALQLVQLVANDADTHEIEALLRRDPTLSYHLLKLVNSLGMGTGRRVTSFSQAILILGRQQLRRWLNLMLFAARDGDLRTAMLLARVSVRAMAMELLARCAGLDKHQQEQAFMTGMFSLLGALFGMPLAEVMQPLTIGESVKQALLAKQGELGVLLGLLEQAEQGDFAAVAASLQQLQLEAADFNAAVAEANQWMLSVTSGAGQSHA